MKSHSLVYRLPNSPRKKKFKTKPSAGVCMLIIFLDYRGIILQECVVKGTKINSKTDVKTLKMLKQ